MTDLALFVAEDPFHNKRFVEALETRSFEVVFCTTADEALYFLGGARKPDLVVTAGKLADGEIFSSRVPAERGLVLYREIRAKYPTLPVVVLTSTRSIVEELMRERDPYFQLVDKSTESAVEQVGRSARELVRPQSYTRRPA